MKTKICILGSTGSIGKTTLKIIKNNKKKYKIILLTTNKNIKLLQKQALEFNVKNLIVFNKIEYEKLKKNRQLDKINIYNDIKSFKKIFNKNKIDYTMSAITGFYGLEPTLKIIKFSKEIAIANKESIICGWNLIERELKKNNTKFVPIDSEHFSIWSLLDKKMNKNLEKVFITASGGPFVNLPLTKFNKIKPHNAIKHPNWKMGKKISVDSSTLMNKVFEVIEARNIFNIAYSKISILTHPKSYVHAIIKFKNGLSKIVVHEPDMKIPIYNSIYFSNTKEIKKNSLNLDILNNLDLKKVDLKKFPLVKLLNKLPNYPSLFETVLITINDYLVYKFLNKDISFQKLIYLIDKFSNSKDFKKFKKIKPKNAEDIYRLRDYVSSKMNSFSI